MLTQTAAKARELDTRLYLVAKEELGRYPSATEMATWRRRIANGLSVAQLRRLISRLPEARLNLLYATTQEQPIPTDLRCDCLERIARGVPLEGVAYYLLGRIEERRGRLAC